MAFEQWLLPVAIILVKLGLKLCIDRQVSLPEFIDGVLALPLDIAFMSSSLLAGLIILDAGNVKSGLGLFMATILVALLAAFLWRRSSARFAKHKYWTMGALFAVNLGLSTTLAAYVVHLLERGSLV